HLPGVLRRVGAERASGAAALQLLPGLDGPPEAVEELPGLVEPAAAVARADPAIVLVADAAVVGVGGDALEAVAALLEVDARPAPPLREWAHVDPPLRLVVGVAHPHPVGHRGAGVADRLDHLSRSRVVLARDVELGVGAGGDARGPGVGDRALGEDEVVAAV